jgi:hypothetical protein
LQTIVTITHGSHLYGTNTPNSDTDYKSVHVPSGPDILLGRISKSISLHSKKDTGLKNTKNDIDTESFSLCKFLSLACEGQTVALELLFATPHLARSAYTDIWQEVYDNRFKLASKNADAFVGYAYKQASKYGIKGSRVSAVKSTVELLEGLAEKSGWTSKLNEHMDVIEPFTKATEYAEIDNIEIRGQDKKIPHLSVCGRKAPLTLSLKETHKIFKHIYDEYGERAKQAEKNEGIDWKALSHALRVGRQSLEYLSTGNIVFPRPEAAYLLAVKLGKIPYASVAEDIELLLGKVKDASAASTLPDKPDRKWCDNFLIDVYRAEVLKCRKRKRV